MVHSPQAVQQTIHHFSGINMLPPIALHVFSCFHKVHSTWRWYRKGALYSNPHNFIPLASGYALHYFSNDSLTLRTAGICVLILRRVRDCVEEQRALNISWMKWIDSFHHKEFHPKIKWYKSQSYGISPSYKNRINLKTRKAFLRIKSIIYRTFQLLYRTFRLSMLLLDAAEALTFHPDALYEGSCHLIPNARLLLDELSENKKKIIDEIESSREVLNNLLVQVRSPITADMLINVLSNGVETTDKVWKTTSASARIGGKVIKIVGQNFIYSAASVFLLQQYLPHWLIPDMSKDQELTPYQLNSAPPDEWVTRPSYLSP